MNTDNKATEHETKDGQHPEDAIYHTKRFINELSKVQNLYFQNLVNNLDINESGEEWLFDYIFNSEEDGDTLTFDEYLHEFKKNYKTFLNDR
jgi:hypothetical protein